jgi:predicted ester cyclase
VPGFISDSPLARGLIRIGDEAIAREDDAKLQDYFAEDYVFHGPGGDLGFEELRGYFASLRAAFSDLRIVREQIIADGKFLAARNTFAGDFTGAFTYSPIGPVEPTGQHVEWEVINTFRYHDDGQLAEEWVQTDYRSFLTKLGVTTTESAQRERTRQPFGTSSRTSSMRTTPDGGEEPGRPASRCLPPAAGGSRSGCGRAGPGTSSLRWASSAAR